MKSKVDHGPSATQTASADPPNSFDRTPDVQASARGLREIEPEPEGVEDTDSITEPFDPEKIKIATRNVVVQQIVWRIEDGGIDLAPDFQRLQGIWDQTRRSRLIESILLRIPLPVFYVAADESENWKVVDGVQRMSTIAGFVAGKYPLSNLEYLTWLDGSRHDELPNRLQRRISETILVVHIIEPGTPPEVMFNVFLRINTGGLTLNAQEIRHALHPGPVRDFLADLSQSEEFVGATGGLNPNRMVDRECVLRCLAFTLSGPEEYRSNDLNAHLDSAMRRINDMDDDGRTDLSQTFKQAMCAAESIFGMNAFRKPPGPGGRYPVNRSLLEVWGVLLGRCSQSQIQNLVKNRKLVAAKFAELIRNDAEFERAISYSTGDGVRVRKRFESIGQLINEFA